MKRLLFCLCCLAATHFVQGQVLDSHTRAALRSELDSIFVLDQKYRLMMDSVENRYGRESKELQALWDITTKVDNQNLSRVTQILDRYGWLGPEEVGAKGNSTLFLVIQHSNQKTQEKYLPMMREAVQNGKARGSSLALLEDRVALGQGRKQIYGSQISWDDKTGKYYIDPIEDEPNVNKRRAAVGLPPLEEYVKRWNIEYKLPKQ